MSNNESYYKEFNFLKFLLTVTVLCFLSACIIMAPTKGVTDEYEKYTESNLISNISFVEIDLESLLQYEINEIYLFATWCPACIVHLRSIQPGYSLQQTGRAYISTNYNIQSIEKYARGNIDTVFILSNAVYGAIESEKIIQFTSELLEQKSELTGLPQVFVKDSKGRFERKLQVKGETLSD